MKTKFFTLLALLFLVLSCNNATDDVHPISEIKLETGPNIPFLINPDELIGRSASDLQFVQNPGRGITDDLVEGRFLKYTPGTDFDEGEDRFDLNIKDTDGNEHLVNVVVKVTDNPCNYGPSFDHIQVRAGESITEDLLANDFFCGQIPTFSNPMSPSGAVSFHLVSSDYANGLGDYFGANLDLFNNQVDATINAPDTPGIIKIIYEVGFDIKPEYMRNFPTSFDYLKEGGGLMPKAFEHYMVAEATIEIID
ncbi:MAG: hypothetical protein HEP71_06480 [Roseivirga sp.]|nr:hypothetical protein [Roseivirga sp.]